MFYLKTLQKEAVNLLQIWRNKKSYKKEAINMHYWYSPSLQLELGESHVYMRQNLKTG